MTPIKGRLYDEIVRIPLILWYPGSLPAGKVIDEPVQCIDIMPTVLELVGLPASGQEQGRSLLPLIAAAGEWSGKPLFFETTGGGYTADSLQYEQRFRAVRTDRWKLVFASPADSYQLFDLADDPLEAEDVAGQFPAVSDSLRDLLSQWSIYTHRRPYMQPEGGLPPDPVEYDLRPPSILSPADGDTLFYRGANFSIEPSWTGPASDAYVIEYEVGEGAYHLQGELEETTSRPQYGPFQANFWNSLVLYNPWRFRVYRKGHPEAKSDWVTFSLAASDSSSAVGGAYLPLVLRLLPAVEAVGQHGANIGVGVALALVDLARMGAAISPADLSAYLLIMVIVAAIFWPRLRRLGVERCKRWGTAILYICFVYSTVPLMPRVTGVKHLSGLATIVSPVLLMVFVPLR